MEETLASTHTKLPDDAQSKATLQITTVQISTDGVPKLHCPVCDKALISLSGYVKHVKKHEPPGGFLCRYCDGRFCSEDGLKKHLDEVHTTLACRICKNNATFTNEEEYREHIRVVHNGVDRELFTCEKCGAEYKTMEPFKRHKETQCGSIKPFKCDQCSMSFVTKYNLKQHKETHSGERKFCCSYCGKNFLQKGRLIEHERSHTGEKPYKCDVCGKAFAHRESIVTHSSIHTGIRLVECRCCQSRFSCYSNLIKHRRTRPDTCGLPEYDPPKNRVRTHRSRIPPTLNPTSEIKVSNLNKIIKPSDLEKDKQLRKSTNRKDEKQETSNVRIKKGRRVRKRKDTLETSEESDNLEDINCRSVCSETDEELTVSKRRTRQNHIDQSLKKEESSVDLSDFDDDSPDSGSERDTNFKLPAPVKQELEESQTESFEYTDSNQYVEPCCDLKVEDGNIFNEKDTLLDDLLKENVSDEHLKITKPFQSVKLENDVDAILEETEVVLIKEQDLISSTEEDVLAVKDIPLKDLTECRILLEDITMRYPKLKGEPSVKVARNAKAQVVIRNVHNQQNEVTHETDKPKRKYRKRREDKGDIVPNGPKRVAKISQHELKERLKMLKKEEKSWKCPLCIKIYHMRKPYEKHLRHDHVLDEEKIKEIFKDEKVTQELEGEVFKCNICDKIYLMEKRLIAHIKLHGPDGSLIFKCPCYCNIFFASKDEATAHAHKEHRDLIYCEQCDKFMTGHDSLKNHMKNHHSRKEPKNLPRNLVCDKCGKKFAGRTSLTDHVRSDCGRVPLYPCTVCGKHLTTAGILKTHMLLHKDESPYQCEKCGKTFKVKAQYKSHIKTRHTDFKPFKCHLCPKEYPYRESLLTHMTVHTGMKRFLCNGCGKRFTCISNLQAHRKVHNDTCGQLPLNAKATQYMGVQKGNLLLGAKPEAGLEYQETNTLIAKDVLDRDMPMAQELNFPSEPSAPLATVPLNYVGQQTAPHFALQNIMIPHMTDEPHSSSTYN